MIERILINTYRAVLVTALFILALEIIQGRFL